MGIEMPAEVRWLIPIVVGDSWPEGDETALQRLAEVWKQAATDVDDAMREAEDAVKQATSNMDGEAAEAFKKYWEKFVKGEEATLPKMKDVSEKLSTACRNCAMQIEYAKLSIIIALVILAIQIAVMIASAVASFGASTAGIVPAQLATRAGVQIVFRQLVQKLMQQVGRNLIGKLALQVGIEVATSVATDLAVQGIQLAKGTRDTLDTKMTLDAAKSGLISGVVGMGVGAGMGKALGDGAGDSIGRSIGRSAAEESITGAGSALAEGALSEEGIKAENVLFGATSGAVSGTVSGTKSGIEGMNADIGVPTAGDMPRPTSGDMPRPDAAPRMDAPPAAPSTAPASTPDAEAPPRRSADATNTSYAAPPTEQPQHRATPDTTPASSAPPPPPSQQQGPGQSPGQSAPQTAPAASNAPAAPRSSMPPAPPMGGPASSSGGGFSPSSSPSSAGGHSTSAGPTPSNAPGTAGGHSPHNGPSPTSGGNAPQAGGPTPSHSPSPTNSGPAPAGTPANAGSSPSGGLVPHSPASTSTFHANPAAAGPVPGGHSPAGPLPSGPPPVSHVPGSQSPGTPGQHLPPAPHLTSAQRPGDVVQQAATSTPFAVPPTAVPPPNRPGTDAAPAQQSQVPAHVPAQQNHMSAAPQQSPTRHQQPSGHQQQPRPPAQQRPRHQNPPPQGPPLAAQHRAAPLPPAAPQHSPSHHPPAAGLPRPVAATDAPTPHERPTRTPWEERKRLSAPVALPDNLRHLQNDVKHTKAGLSLHDNNFKAYAQSAAMVAPDPHRYTVDLHGSADDVRVGDTKLSPKDLADIIRSSGDWDGEQPVRLISCQTGTTADGFAAQLSKELGVDVVSPTKDAWVDDMGNVFASSTEFDRNRGDFSPGWPPNGDWVTFKPDGTSTKHDRPTPPGTTPTWGDSTPEGRPRAWRRGEDGTWVTDANDNWHFVPARNAPPPHPVRGNEQPQWQPNQGQPNLQGPPPPGRMPPRPQQGPPQQGPPPQRFPQGGAPQPNPMRHDPRQQQPRVPAPEPRRYPPQQQPGFGPRGFDPNQQHHRQGPPNQPQHPRQAPGFVPNQDQRPPAPPRGPDGRPLPPRPTQAPQSFGPDPRYAAPDHRPQQRPHDNDSSQQQHQPRPTPAQQPLSEQPKEVQRTPQGLDWVPLEEQLTATRDRKITHTEIALRDRALDLYFQEKMLYKDRSVVRAEVADYKVGLDGRFIEKPREIPTLERPARLTPEYLNVLAKHTSDYGEPATPALSFTPKSDDLPPGRTAQIPHGAYANTVVPVNPSHLHFNTSGNGDRLIHRNEPDFLNKKNALFRRMDHDMAGLYRGDGIRPRGTSGNAEAHITGTTTGSIYTSFTDSLDHVVNRSPSSSLKEAGVRADFIVEAYHQFGIDSDSSFHDAGVRSPHRENEYLFAGGMPDEHIFRVWELKVTFDVNGNVTSTEVVGAQINPRFKYLSQMGDR